MSANSPTRTLWIVVTIVAATIVAYVPVLGAGFIWDDNDWVTENPAVTGGESWGDIWTGNARLQYYPLLFSAFRVQHMLWGLNPAGYHAVNVALHALTAVLVGFLGLRLQLRGAWWIAALFALHPVHVESVAWITELKNVLSGALVVAAACAFVYAVDRERVARRPLAAALLLFTAAVLAKTAVAMVALLLPLLLYYRRSRLDARVLVPVAPFVAVGVVLAWIAVRLEQGMAAAAQADFTFSAADRLLIGAHAWFFYPHKLLVPYPLIFNYPRWDLGVWHAWLWPLAALVGTGLVALARRRRIRAVALALIAYAILLAPALGVFDVYAFRYSFVADHFAYLASIPLIALVVEVAARALPGSSRQRLVIGAGIALALGVMTWNQTHAYKDRETLWRHTIRLNPDSWLAHHSLALEALNSGRDDVAADHLDEAIRCKPAATESWTGRGLLRARSGNPVGALADFDEALELSPQYPQARLHRGRLRVALGELEAGIDDLDLFLAVNPSTVDALASRAEAYARLGRYPEALADLDDAIAFGGPADLIVARGSTRVAMGDLDGAERDAALALQDAAVAPIAWELRGAILLRRNDEAGACQALRRACDLGQCRGWQGTCSDSATP